MTDQATPDSFNSKSLTETICEEVLEKLKSEGIVPVSEVRGTLSDLQQVVNQIEAMPLSRLVQGTIAELKKEGLIAPAPQEGEPPSVERYALRVGTEDEIHALDEAKSGLISHCFKLMLSEGIKWEDIVSEIASCIPGNEQETMKHLQALENLNLTPSHFS